MPRTAALKPNNILPALLVLFLASAFVTGCGPKPPEPSPDVQFAATFVTDYGEDSVEYMVNLTADKVRLELAPPNSGVIIIRKDMGVIWTLMSTSKLFLERPIVSENKFPLMFMPDKVLEYEIIGEETLDGRTVIKERLVIQNEGEDKKEILRWFAPDLGWPVRAEDPDGNQKLSFKDIVPGPQEPGLFEAPPDFRMIAGRKKAEPGQGPH